MMHKNWTTPLDTPSADTRYTLVCFPYAGGGTVHYRKWREHLPKEIHLCAINLPGRERYYNEPAYQNFDALVQDLAAEIDQHNNPLLFFGHSYGSLCAYFTARILKSTFNKDIDALFVSARTPPFTPLKQALAALPDDAFIEVLSKSYGGIPEAILSDEKLLAFFLPMMKNDFRLYEQYPELYQQLGASPLSCSIGSLSYTNDCASEAECRTWRQCTTSHYHHSSLSGGHFTLLENPKPVIAFIRAFLQKKNVAKP